MVSEWRMRTSLKELLETAKRKTSLKLVLELKAHSKPEREIKAVEEIVSMIKKMGLEPRMIYITFSSHALKELIRQAPTSTPVYYLKGDLSPQQLKELGSAGPDYHFSEFTVIPIGLKLPCLGAKSECMDG